MVYYRLVKFIAKVEYDEELDKQMDELIMNALHDALLTIGATSDRHVQLKEFWREK
jgi:hypothetical protein